MKQQCRYVRFTVCLFMFISACRGGGESALRAGATASSITAKAKIERARFMNRLLRLEVESIHPRRACAPRLP